MTKTVERLINKKIKQEQKENVIPFYLYLRKKRLNLDTIDFYSLDAAPVIAFTKPK